MGEGSPQRPKSSVKFGGKNVMDFGMIAAAGKERLVRLYNKINTTVFKDILKKHVILNLRIAFNQPIVFMQDNASCHSAKSVKTFLSEEDVTATELPAQSLHINPIENVWKLLNERAKEKIPKNVEEQWTNLKGEWEKISVDECKT